MDANLRLLVSCHLCMTIIRQKKERFWRNRKDTVKRMFTLELCISLCVYGLYLGIVVCAALHI